LYSPQAVFNTLLRPLPNEIGSMLMIPAIIENVLLVIFTLMAIFFHNKKLQHIRIIYFSLFFCLVLSVITGITTPVLGALVRYRIPVLPFLCIALFLIIDFKKAGKFFGIKSIESHE